MSALWTDLHLTVLPFELVFCSVPKSQILPNAATFVELFLFAPESQPRFFSYTETSDDAVSIILDPNGLESFRKSFCMNPSVMISDTKWHAIHLHEGSEVESGLVSSVSGVLASKGFSIFYLSTNDADLVLVKASDLDAVLQSMNETEALPQHISELSSESWSSVPASPPLRSSPSPSEPPPPSDSGSSPTASPSELKVSEVHAQPGDAKSKAAQGSSPDGLKLRVLPHQLFLHSIPSSDIETYAKRILQLILFPKGGLSQDRFLSYSEIEDSISLVLDQESLSLLQGEQEVAAESWTAIRVLGEFGFDETGIVYSLSEPLSRAKICPFYFSTFYRDFLLVQEQSLDEATEILKQKFVFE